MGAAKLVLVALLWSGIQGCEPEGVPFEALDEALAARAGPEPWYQDRHQLAALFNEERQF